MADELDSDEGGCGGPADWAADELCGSIGGNGGAGCCGACGEDCFDLLVLPLLEPLLLFIRFEKDVAIRLAANGLG